VVYTQKFQHCFNLGLYWSNVTHNFCEVWIKIYQFFKKKLNETSNKEFIKIYNCYLKNILIMWIVNEIQRIKIVSCCSSASNVFLLPHRLFSSNALILYLRGAPFKPWLEHWVSWLMFLVAFLSSHQANAGIVHLLCHDCFLSYPLEFNIHQ
jgi:hypothetical protein